MIDKLRSNRFAEFWRRIHYDPLTLTGVNIYSLRSQAANIEVQIALYEDDTPTSR